MIELADRKWEPFLIQELFEIKSVKGQPIENYKNGKSPYISTAAVNNALIGFVSSDRNTLSEGNVISIDPIKGKAFYHESDFVGRGFSGASINLLYNYNINKYVGLFLCTAIEMTSKNKASYGNLFNSQRLRNGKFLLPIDINNNPDWHFMEDYIKERYQLLINQYKEYFRSLDMTGEAPLSLDEKEWWEFVITDIFTISAGKRLTKNDMQNGKRPFIGATDSNNGITNFVSNENVSLDKEVLGVNYNGSVVETFYHPYESIFSDDVKRFSVKNGKGNKFVYLFLKSTIMQQKSKYAYGYKFNEARMKKQVILLPIGTDNLPDWEYMENYSKWQMKEKLENYLEYLEVNNDRTR